MKDKTFSTKYERTILLENIYEARATYWRAIGALERAYHPDNAVIQDDDIDNEIDIDTLDAQMRADGILVKDV